jgi:hypothetical protein
MNIEILKKILDYNKETGIFTWKESVNRKIKKGKVAGSKNKVGYVYIRFKSKLYACHRLAYLYITGKNPRYVIDHINGKKDDNRFDNLRDVEIKTNTRNTFKAHKNNKSSGIIGVSWDKNKWVVRIRTDNKRINIGRYDDINIAKNAYLEAKRKYHLEIF